VAEPERPHDPVELRRQLAEKSRLLSELEVMLSDYQDERSRLIQELRGLQSQLREAEESLPSVETARA